MREPDLADLVFDDSTRVRTLPFPSIDATRVVDG
jgi:hypothetical protein